MPSRHGERTTPLAPRVEPADDGAERFQSTHPSSVMAGLDPATQKEVQQAEELSPSRHSQQEDNPAGSAGQPRG